MYRKVTRLEDVIENPLQAIFHALQSFDVPWQNLDINISLDSDYNICHSGKKMTSPLVDFFINTETGKIDSTSMTLLANIIYTKYGAKWRKQYDTMFFEYDPISNYDMIEIMKDDETKHVFGHKTDVAFSNESENANEYESSDETENTKAGFNSSDYQKDNATNTTSSGSQSNNTNASGTQSNTESGTNTDTRNYKLTRTGNIGVTTSQQMIEAERQLWMWNFFEAIVYPDIDRVLTIEMY